MIIQDYLRQRIQKNKVIPIFIFDTSITDKLPNNDRRINFIFDNLVEIDLKLKKKYIIRQLMCLKVTNRNFQGIDKGL